MERLVDPVNETKYGLQDSFETFRRAAQRVAELEGVRPAKSGMAWLAEYRTAQRDLHLSLREYVTYLRASGEPEPEHPD
jgi:hypothetical protein